ncbi:hypothetical protein [Mycobacterium sp. 141]|uniref:hypothetical protein n=1 Tax=Mycobacterium sp. 141 TaxID=1120797 RepID=UPI0012DBF3B4|nr:hypothetical protein [Mycobacterium sp. 141]
MTKLVAAGAWDGILCPKNDDADVLIEKRSWVAGGNAGDRRCEYWIHCPKCGAEIFFQSKDEYEPKRKPGTG